MPSSSESGWVPLTPQLTIRDETVKDDIKISVFMSPYDAPQAVRGRFDEKAKKFFIDLKYLDDEQASEEHRGATEGIALHIGKNSGRLLSIQIDVGALKA